ncbi:hypothetical protein [Vibrio sp. TRT 17S01]|uniref:hypothetical protein n=1 Tax=Vibrio sp. TRT 17S01 TaxID=3418505 RepID=UPI003CE9AA2C
MKKNIVTHGSCLSIKVADSLVERFNFKRVSSTQHVRTDVYVDTYIKQILDPIKSYEFHFQYKEQYKDTGLVENQIIDMKFGRSLPGKLANADLVNHRDAIESGKIDLLLIDNFPDIYFKVYKNQIDNQKLFLNKEYFEYFDDNFVFENEFLAIDKYVESLEILIKDFKKHNPISEVVFINFPVNLNSNEFLRNRALEMYKRVLSIPGICVIDPIGVYRHDLTIANDIHHFTPKKYRQIASTVFGEVS